MLLPVAVSSGTGEPGLPVCEVLVLELGPITLNVLGLNLDIGGPAGTPVIIELTADPTLGLLGQLLCPLAGGVPLNLPQLVQLSELLNALFGLLG